MLTLKKLNDLIDKNKTINQKQSKIDFDKNLAYVPSKEANIILRVSNLEKTFNAKTKKEVKVLKGINLNIYDGDCIALIGANGAGKTTFIEILSGVQEPTKGELNFGYSYSYSPFEKIGVQFQTSHYPSGLTVKDIIRFITDTRRTALLSPKVKDEMIKTFGLTNLLNNEANSLSGGQRQRLNILLALIVSPKLVFLDELTTGLDVFSQKNILNYIKQYASDNKVTLISISHNLLEIEKLANRIILLKNGKIQIDADVEKIKKQYKTIGDFVVKYLS